MSEVVLSRVLITGCSKGIGRATARLLAAGGHEVVASARDLRSIEDLDVSARVALDVTDPGSVASAVAAAGELDALVNNAGEIALGPVEAVPIDEVRHLFDLNVFGQLRMVQAVVPQMRARGQGTIINLSSVVGRVTMPLNGVYGATKYAVEALSEALRFELAPFGVRVAVVEPGVVATGALEAPRAYAASDDAYGPLAAQIHSPGQEMLAPEQVAEAIADVIEADRSPLRRPVGSDAEALLAARAALDDDALDATLRQSLGIDWSADAPAGAGPAH